MNLTKAGLIVPPHQALQAQRVLREAGLAATLKPPAARPWREIEVWADQLTVAHEALGRGKVLHLGFTRGSALILDVRCADTGERLGELRARLDATMTAGAGPVSFTVLGEARGHKSPVRVVGYQPADAADAELSDGGPRLIYYAPVGDPVRRRAVRSGRM